MRSDNCTMRPSPIAAPRKVVQLAGMGVANTSRTQTDAILVALCDDGSLWACDAPFTKWDRLPNVPQED